MYRIICFFILIAVNAASAAQPQLICETTIPEGMLNYQDSTSGLNRISSIVVARGSVNTGGYGVKLTLQGTSGIGEKAAVSVVDLPWSFAFGSDLIAYD
ncbi:MAG: hypothetical protein EOP06_26310, partial [Proteobacteria bacterium]